MKLNVMIQLIRSRKSTINEVYSFCFSSNTLTEWKAPLDLLLRGERGFQFFSRLPALSI